MINQWIAILIISILSQQILAIQNYDGTRPSRGSNGSNRTDMDNISLRLEGQHLSRTCPALIEQKAKNIPPRVCRYFAIAEKSYPPKIAVCTSPIKYCCDNKHPVVKRCKVGTEQKFDFFSRLLLRSKNGKLKCQWEGCPIADYFNLASYNVTVPATATDPAKTYTLNYRPWGESTPAPVEVECKPDVGNEECDPDNQTLPNCDKVGCGGSSGPGPGPGA
jgi:hypothetical protein